ncbi:hypothetical protein G6011_09511 [Alternaria panax]|uniref:F-box domain-containing protein n=1 Tax=Alternaria panax TaxID=48097 RepID=A0AAD4NP71_9PLEO|nr:hypothetical protein G6011_09511 [Alternaria panax]
MRLAVSTFWTGASLKTRSDSFDDFTVVSSALGQGSGTPSEVTPLEYRGILSTTYISPYSLHSIPTWIFSKTKLRHGIANTSGSKHAHLDDDSLTVKAKQVTKKKPLSRKEHKTSKSQSAFNRNKLGFLDLPTQLRLKIYRYCLIEVRTITVFSSSSNGPENLAFNLLRTCQVIHSEGAEMLYSENVFRFSHPPAVTPPTYTHKHLPFDYVPITQTQ